MVRLDTEIRLKSTVLWPGSKTITLSAYGPLKSLFKHILVPDSVAAIYNKSKRSFPLLCIIYWVPQRCDQETHRARRSLKHTCDIIYQTGGFKLTGLCALCRLLEVIYSRVSHHLHSQDFLHVEVFKMTQNGINLQNHKNTHNSLYILYKQIISLITHKNACKNDPLTFTHTV